MKNSKKAFALVALALAMGLAGCGETNSKDSGSSDTDTANPTSNSDSNSESEKPTPANPTIVLTGETEATVKAGTPYTLPTAKATDYLGKDLTSSIEVEDSFESGTIKNNVLTAYAAGDHIISYYVQDGDGRETEKSVTVHVTPAHEENFEVEGNTDPKALSAYGVFKENFAKGKKSPLAAYTDSNGAAKITATEDAIAGNSIVLDMNKTAGNAAHSFFLNAFNDSFVRGKAATYNVSFQYKVLTANGNTNDVYFGLSWDGSNGINNNFIAATGSDLNTVYTYNVTFTGANVPETGNAYFFFFKLSGSSDECKIAIDSFTISSKEVVQVVNTVPTRAQLEGEAGFTWNHVNVGTTFTNGEVVKVSDMENETIKNAIKATSSFSDNVMKLVGGTDSHLMGGLTNDNLIEGKKLVIDFDFYKAKSSSFYFIMMTNSGNPTIGIVDNFVTKTNGNIKTVHMEYKLPAGATALNFYAANPADFEVYLGNISAKLVEPEAVEPGKTPLGYEVGQSWTYSSRQWGNENKGKWECSATAESDTPNYATYKTKWVFNGVSDVTNEWKQMGGQVMEKDCTYSIKFSYEVKEGFVGDLMYRMDGAFVNVGLDKTAGTHVTETPWKADHAVDFFSFYVAGNVTVNGTMFVKDVVVTLTSLAE